MTRARTPSFAERLLNWWDRHGRQDLPWQHPRTPYRVWVSEIMLQQTQVTTVIPYFERWMKSFPDIDALASASLDEVLAHWSGLGYYARARNLHKAAVLCAQRHGGELPLEPAGLEALPGIGRSTANAIISQAADEPAAVLDGNVRRVLARHIAIEGWTGKASVQKRLWDEAESRLPEQRGADYTQAIMDLGATVCIRSGPDCPKCPVREDCRALSLGKVDELPSPKPAARVSDRTVQLLILRDGSGRVLLERRPPAGIWGGLWCLPELGEDESSLGLEYSSEGTLSAIEHRLSHIRMTIVPLLATAAVPGQVKCSPQCDWFSPGQQNDLGLPKPVADLLKRLDKGELK